MCERHKVFPKICKNSFWEGEDIMWWLAAKKKGERKNLGHQQKLPLVPPLQAAAHAAAAAQAAAAAAAAMAQIESVLMQLRWWFAEIFQSFFFLFFPPSPPPPPPVSPDPTCHVRFAGWRCHHHSCHCIRSLCENFGTYTLERHSSKIFFVMYHKLHKVFLNIQDSLFWTSVLFFFRLLLKKKALSNRFSTKKSESFNLAGIIFPIRGFLNLKISLLGIFFSSKNSCYN